MALPARCPTKLLRTAKVTARPQPGTEWDDPLRKRVLVLRNDCNISFSEIQNRTGELGTTIHRIVSSTQPRHHINPRSGRPQKLTGRDARGLVRVLTLSEDGRKASYLNLAKELGIQAPETTVGSL